MRGLVLLAVLALAGCGGRAALEPAPGKTMPPKPLAAKTVPTTDDLLKPSMQSRPARSDELLRRSEERQDDRFELPPQD